MLDTYEAQDVLILVFIHGWRHNADNDDEHVQEFQTLLGEMHPIEEVRASEQPRTPRRILGVYVGWRGLSWAIEPLSLLTFGARQAKARAIGSGQLYELLLDLEGYRNAKNGREGGTRLIIAGHSLGASILYHAVSHDLRRRLHVRRQQSEIVPPFGDLFLLLNPALTTGEFQLLRDAAIEGQPYPPNQAPVMLTALSVSDDTIKRWYHLDGLRASLTNDPGLDRGLIRPLNLNRCFQTHELRLEEVDNPLHQVPIPCEENRDACRPYGDRWILKPISQSKENDLCWVSQVPRHKPVYEANYPFPVILAPEEVIPDHGGIFTPAFREFMYTYIDTHLRGEQVPGCD